MNKIGNQKSEIGNVRAFTLIELLVVISIMGILAGFTFPVLKMVKRQQYLKIARAELEQVAGALDNYKAQYGAYPPGNGAGTIQAGLTNQLYYELLGTTYNSTTKYYTTLDSSATILDTAFTTAFNVGGIINCTKGSGEDAASAKSFLLGLKQNRIGTVGSINLLITSVKGPDTTYTPVGVVDVNPFRYVYPGVQNPNSYDLWVQLVISGKTNLICNWNKQVQINSPLP